MFENFKEDERLVLSFYEAKEQRSKSAIDISSSEVVREFQLLGLSISLEGRMEVEVRYRLIEEAKKIRVKSTSTCGEEIGMLALELR